MFKIKNIIVILCLLSLTAVNTSNSIVYAEDTQNESYINEKIASVGFGKIFNATDPKDDIKNLFKKLDNVSQKKDLKKMQSFYCEDFVNNDGYDYTTYFNAVKDAIKDYNFNSVKTDIKNISVSGNYAYAHVIENIEGETLLGEPPHKDTTLILSCSEIIYTLKKEGNNWKIFSAETIDETSSFLYGEAKNIFFSIQVPNYVKNGIEYTAELTHSPVSKDIIIMASISSHPIIYPAPKQEDKFKCIKDDSSLERVFVANKNNVNEDVIAIVHISRAKIVNANEVDIKPLGSAYVVKRVNVINTNKSSNILKTKKANNEEKQKNCLKNKKLKKKFFNFNKKEKEDK